MATRSDAERIAKFLARAAMTDSAAEADMSVRSAYARMQRDGVTFDDLLRLSDDALYQRGLIALVEYIVASSTELSESGKRELYAKYLQQVAARFSSSRTEREEQQQEKAHKREYANTSEQQYANTSEPRYDNTSSPSFAAVFSKHGLTETAKGMLVITANAFRRGGFVWHCARNPGRALKLFAAAGLFGLGGGIALLLIAASLHSFLGIGGPWIDMKVQTAWALTGSVLFLYKAISLYRSGWF